MPASKRHPPPSPDPLTGCHTASFLVTGLIDRLQRVFAEFAGVGENIVDQIGRKIGVARQVRLFLHLEQFVQQEFVILNRRTVDRHGLAPQRTAKSKQRTANSECYVKSSL